MHTRTSHLLLGIIAAALVVLAVRPYLDTPVVHADTQSFDPIYVEPGVTMLRVPNGGQVLGKVVMNLRTGNIYGYPTGTGDPYPYSAVDNKPQISHPIPLGRFVLGEAR